MQLALSLSLSAHSFVWTSFAHLPFFLYVQLVQLSFLEKQYHRKARVLTWVFRKPYHLWYTYFCVCSDTITSKHPSPRSIDPVSLLFLLLCMSYDKLRYLCICKMSIISNIASDDDGKVVACSRCISIHIYLYSQLTISLFLSHWYHFSLYSLSPCPSKMTSIHILWCKFAYLHKYRCLWCV